MPRETILTAGREATRAHVYVGCQTIFLEVGPSNGLFVALLLCIADFATLRL